MSKTKGFLLAVAVAALAFTFSCSSDDYKDDGGGNGDRDSRLVTGSDEAWIGLYYDDEGIIFWSNGEFAIIELYDGTWELSGGTWTTRGSELMLSNGSYSETFAYSVSGNMLTIGGAVFIKTSGINFGGGGGSSSSVGGGGGRSSSSVGSGGSSSSSARSSSSYGGGSTCSANFRTVRIGSQTWMAENLNCNVSGSKCYDNNPSYCSTYGRLYNWYTAQSVCPSGWHLPSMEDWEVMTAYIGGASTEGKKLKATSDWNGNGTDNYGFSALPGGGGFSDGSFYGAGYYGYWWSSTENYTAYSRVMGYGNEDAYWYSDVKDRLFSVRCLKD